MKRLLIAVALLALTVLLCGGPLWYLEHSTADMLRTLDTAEVALQRGDDAALGDAVSALNADFKRANRILPMFFSHAKTDDIEESVTLLATLTHEQAALLAEELTRCRYRIDHLRQSERLTFSNIF